MTIEACPERPGAHVAGPHADAVTAVGIVIPARNEEAVIRRCLDSVSAAAAHFRRITDGRIPVRVVVVLDRCTDRTAEIVAGYPGVETRAVAVGNVGAARAYGTSAVLALTTDLRRRVWLANTDADSTVPREWLVGMVGAAQRGADVVLGTVEPDDSVGNQLGQAWRARHSARDGHPHVHGANFGIRASAYAELGGWRSHPSGEDAELVRAAEAAGDVRIARSGSIPVTTSSRLVGRAPHGFAHYLQRLNHELGGVAPATGTGAGPTPDGVSTRWPA